jgi:hypothetical protein
MQRKVSSLGREADADATYGGRTKHFALQASSRKNKSKWVEKYRATRDQAMRKKNSSAGVGKLGGMDQNSLMPQSQGDMSIKRSDLGHTRSAPAGLKRQNELAWNIKLPPINMREALPCESWLASRGHNNCCEVSGRIVTRSERKECL